MCRYRASGQYLGPSVTLTLTNLNGHPCSARIGRLGAPGASIRGAVKEISFEIGQ